MSASTLISTEGSPTLSVSAAGSATAASSSVSSSSSSSISSSFFFSDSFTFIPPLRTESVNRTSRSRRFINPPQMVWQYPWKDFCERAHACAQKKVRASANELIDLEYRQEDRHDDGEHDETHDDDQQRLEHAQH